MPTPLLQQPAILRFPFLPGVELRLRPGVDIGQREGYLALCEDNPDLQIERNARGELMIAMPTKGFTGARNLHLSMLLGIWSLADGTGLAFDSSAGFDLPDGSTLSPDAAWVRNERLQALTEQERAGFLPLAPDFVAELRSDTDRLTILQEKMMLWIRNGVRLGLLLDPSGRQVFVYRPGQDVEQLENPASVDCSPELPGFVLDIAAIFAIGN